MLLGPDGQASLNKECAPKNVIAVGRRRVFDVNLHFDIVNVLKGILQEFDVLLMVYDTDIHSTNAETKEKMWDGLAEQKNAEELIKSLKMSFRMVQALLEHDKD